MPYIVQVCDHIRLDMYDIVLAVKEDTDEVLALYDKQKGKEFCPWTDDYPGIETIDFDLKRDALYVMKEEGKIIAAISLEEDEDVDALECWNKDLAPGGELARLCVLPGLQSKGIGKIMLKQGMDELKRRGFKSVHFLVNKYNVKALKCYETFGFDIVGECHMFEQDFLCYEKEL